MKEKYVIIVAGGKGLRMGTEVPKQFLPLCGKPVLMHTINAFFRYDNRIKIILVLPEEQRDYWVKLCDEHDFKISHRIVSGGETRFHSVRNGLQLIQESAIVGIHDGVRPIVPVEVIARCFATAEQKGGAFPVVPVVDTLRKRTASGSVWVDRSEYCLVQTPQVFRSEIIQDAYRQEYSATFTDDVSVVEALGGFCVEAVEGDRSNIKITTPVDLKMAESIIK